MVTGALNVLLQRVLLCPIPVVGPDVCVEVVDVLVGRDALIECRIALAAPNALRANADKMPFRPCPALVLGSIE